MTNQRTVGEPAPRCSEVTAVGSYVHVQVPHATVLALRKARVRSMLPHRFSVGGRFPDVSVFYVESRRFHPLVLTDDQPSTYFRSSFNHGFSSEQVVRGTVYSTTSPQKDHTRPPIASQRDLGHSATPRTDCTNVVTGRSRRGVQRG
jgi:hypothetical protein